MAPKLHTFFRSSAAYRVRIALQLKGVGYDAVPVHFRRAGGEHRSAEFLGLNPQGLLPVLEIDGIVLTQSLAIIDYLDTRFPEPRLIPDDPIARARVLAMAQIVACEMHPLNNLRVLEYLRGELGLAKDAVNAWYAHWIAMGFDALESLVAAHGGRYCFGDTITLADVCLVPQIYNARRFACDLSPYPRLLEIDARLAVHDAIVRAHPESQPDAE
jgi:maleylacetoacetate isomerase